MGKMADLKRTKEFKKAAVYKAVKINDPRFGTRKIHLNQSEKPTTFSYANPGRNWWGYN
jgi:hypothetical protein